MPKPTNHEKAIKALLESTSIRSASSLSGLSETTLYRYLRDEGFLTKYRTARRQIVEHAISQLQGITSEAVETLRRNLTCDQPSVEIRSAQIILQSAVGGVETIDLLERLEKIENEYLESNQEA
ncbi:MAG TPA: hypothetical protein VMM38_09245 [Aridibacter sp.]|nr:hypothetical protein [Aridibacter sp.]